MAHAQLLITGVTLTLVPFYVVPELQVAHGGIQGRRTRIDVAERLLHDMQRGTLSQDIVNTCDHFAMADTNVVTQTAVVA